MSFPRNALPRDVPWTKKMSGYHSESTKFYEAQSAEDWLGNRFYVGGAVLYCIAAGRGQMLAVGEVLGIRYRIMARTEYLNPTTGIWVQGSWKAREDGWPVRKTLYDDIEVQIHTAATSGGWNNEKRSRPAWANPMNITAIVPSMASAMNEKVK